MDKQKLQMTQGAIAPIILKFFFPLLLGTFFQQMYNMADTIIVGRFVSTQALAAVGATGALMNMVNGFFTGIGSGATVVLSQFYGAGDEKGVDRSLHTAVALSLVLGGLITILGVSFSPMVLRAMNTPDSCLSISVSYIRVIFAGAVASMAYNMSAGILRAMGDSKRPVYYLIFCAVLNIALDILLVVYFRMGAVGAALATVASQCISAVFLLRVLVKLPGTPLNLRRLRLDFSLMKRILYIGLPAGLQFVTFDLSNILVQSGINSFGDVTMAAWTAEGKTDTITWMVSGAFGVSVTTFVGQNFGAGQYDRIRKGVRVCLGMSLFVIGSLAALEAVFREQILGIYTTDADVIAVGCRIILLTVPFNPIFMPTEIFAGAMRGVGYSLAPTIITGVCVCLFRVVWLYTVVARFHRLEMLAIAYPISWTLCMATFTVVYLHGHWLRVSIARSMPDAADG